MKRLINSNLHHVYLKPGELFLSRDPAVISTVLGSCVSITVFAPAAGLGAMCHVLLPSGPIEDGFRYVDSTLNYMVEKIHGMGIKASSCEVKLFGGGEVLPPLAVDKRKFTIGRQNIEATHRMLDSLQIVPKASDLGGEHGRKVVFNAYTGDVFLKKMPKSQF
jgi:chemotaxis protein CheD